jgi:cytochrome c oxidase subunit 1
MFLQGMHGVHRRWWDGGGKFLPDGTQQLTYHVAGPVLHWNGFMSNAAFWLALFQLPFILNFFWSMFAGKKVESDNPWHATTVEWDTPTPPGHGNFTKPITVYRGPYEYSVPGADKDYTPQTEPPNPDKPATAPAHLAATPAHAH